MNTKSDSRSKEHYQTLDLTEEASAEEIERQYERLSRLYQPERMDDPEDRAYAQTKLAEIEEAYAVLSDPARRAIYDGRPLDGAITGDEILYCANHPDVETLLRCNRCGKPICMKCAVQTPVGYRCRECVSNQQKVYFNAVGSDNLIAFGVGLVVTAIAAPLVGLLIGGFGFFGLIIAFIAGSGAGSALAQIIRRSVGRRRGKYLPMFALLGIILGVLLGNIAFFLFLGGFPLFSLPMLLFTALALASAYPQLR
jgi:curved DNA-binding protein CbpA